MLYHTLADLPLTRTAIISSLSIQGDLRRRIQDLGFSPGNTVTALFRSPLGDPTAYRVFDTVIALRKKEAKHIGITILEKEDLS